MTSEGALAQLVGLAPGRLPALVADLARLRITVAGAESLTGGLLCALLTEVPGSSAVVRGGLVVYATELKHQLAGVDADLLAARGPVDPEVAIQLAQGVRSVCGATVGLGLTGVAGPDPQHGVPVGTWFVALVGESGHHLVSGSPGTLGAHPRTPQTAHSLPSGRERIRNDAVRGAVDLLTELVARS
ncbi:nicotinamide-nucleotide amidase [Nakamurella sp. UYEF19]|uniref:CinA family protein n=1 Tax=Nakamurella sp. UYEF19 TaxID=1756392 RepID=UPI00339833EC